MRGYEFDHTQGPSCALACAASAVWRNYFVPMGSASDAPRGQRAGSQINNLAGMQRLLGDRVRVFNGYTQCDDIEALAAYIHGLSADELDQLRASLRIGVHSEAEVTSCRPCVAPPSQTNQLQPPEPPMQADQPAHHVTQVLCSACAVGSSSKLKAWRPLASLILEAAYEATLAVAARNLGRGGAPFVYLTLLGGGAFGNGPRWIEAAVARALSLYRSHALHVRIVHRSAHGPWMAAFQQLAARYRGKNELLRLRHRSWQVVADDDESEEEEEDSHTLCSRVCAV